jgi:hypothetical protein
MPQLGYKRGLAQPNALGASVPRFVSLAIRTALGSMWHHALQIFRFVCKRKRASRTGRDRTRMPSRSGFSLSAVGSRNMTRGLSPREQGSHSQHCILMRVKARSAGILES